MILEPVGLPFSQVADLLDVLRKRGETVATAESLTAGLVAAALTDVPGASDVVRGGLVVYATDLKAELAGVDSELLAECGAVHPRVAEMLADGARTRCRADWGIGLTGVAGPDPQDGVAPGTVHLGFAGPGGAAVHSVRLPGDRHGVRAAAVRVALEHFADLLR
ncbi:nicotinamide-nucleotide amidase [Saccharopolyspora antimicrobica]|uniref:Nicotinamide-nucleotide amidase n=1 Tax=Saccharopolyspora antimicrobica TaxID=455193 RepID=A0A1I4SPT1_9PSEU|nr:CinA family protein [Saccharopolyspora antimicrobica]RKT86056.1 nicotinamide-nucleotide amidase [Saccharopolyspora antimicrobica]SFM66391.1 nicotinamide-nucleotide amidase [Saccharopolyspora antimicrobica]